MSGEEKDKLSFETADDLTNFLIDLQGQLVNMQETVDKLSPVEEDNPTEKTEETEETEEDDPTEEELSEIDALLQRK